MTTFVFILIIFHRLQVMDGLGTHHPSLHITQITYTIEQECVVVLSCIFSSLVIETCI